MTPFASPENGSHCIFTADASCTKPLLGSRHLLTMPLTGDRTRILGPSPLEVTVSEERTAKILNRLDSGDINPPEDFLSVPVGSKGLDQASGIGDP